jgi:hypothetical protein
MKPTIRLVTHKDPHLSQSFFGGMPKVPPDFEWPIWDATPYYLDEIKYAEEYYRACRTELWKKELEKN